MSRVVGVDLGGTWLRVAIVDTSDPTSNAAIDVHRYPSPNDWDQLTDILKRHRTDDITGFGVAVSGPVKDHAMLIQGPNLPWLSGRSIRRDLERVLEKKVIVSNDMEAATEGEMAYGVLKSYDWAIFDTISTGWGGNLILDGKRVDSEPGHANISFSARQRCGAGHVGCYEAIYSGSALERRIRQRMEQAPTTEHDPWGYFQNEMSQKSFWAGSMLDQWAEGVGPAWANMAYGLCRRSSIWEQLPRIYCRWHEFKGSCARPSARSPCSPSIG
jgi:predicted NBD/HSP70 family sugar kinase